jgi:hypothetical protein
MWLLLVGALLVRLPGMFHDFWLDEVWSYQLVREFVTSPADILTRLQIDNNHPLNSWFLYVLGDRRVWFVYRVPALLMGTASVALAGSILSRRGRPHAVAAMILIGFSYPLIVYSSEARGYAPMIFFTLLAIEAHDRYLAASAWTALAIFWAAAVLGFLSHLTFLDAYAAIVVWTATACAGDRTVRGALARTARCHVVPLVFLAGYYLVYVRHLRIAGAEPASLSSVIAETMAVTAGIPGHGAWLGLAVALVTMLLMAALVWIRTTDAVFFRFFLAGIVVMPAVMVLVESWHALMPPRFFPRYFLVSTTLSLILCAWWAGESYQRGGVRRTVTVLLVLLWTVGNVTEVTLFAWYGRGHYFQAVEDMANGTRAGEIRVSSNSDFRTATLLGFYRRYLPAERTLVYYPRSSARNLAADWRIVEDVEPNASPLPEVDDGRGNRFQLVKRFPFFGLSGCQWSLYERSGLARTAPGSLTP